MHGSPLVGCANATSTSQQGDAITLTPLVGTPYARYGVGHGNMTQGGQKAQLTFAATGDASWDGQFVGGCAALFISMHKENMQVRM